MAVELSALVGYLDGFLAHAAVPDYPPAHNGLQLEGRSPVRAVAAAVDASVPVAEAAAAAGVDLLLVHHGLLWDGAGPLVGPRFRRLRALISGGVGVYASHLPLDAHPEVGNNIRLLRALALEPAGRFAHFQGTPLGWWAATDLAFEELVRRAEAALGGPVRCVGAQHRRVRRVGVLTGAGGGALADAAALGLDAVVTGELTHPQGVQAEELGLAVLLGGHYATETFGVRALAAHLADRFELRWTFLDHPTGL